MKLIPVTFEDLIQRLLIGILSGYCSFIVFQLLPLPSNYIVPLQIIIGVLGGLFPFIIAPIILIMYIFVYQFPRIFYTINIYSYITLLGYIILLFIISLYSLIRYNSYKPLISSESIIAQSLGFPYLLFSSLGIKESRDGKLSIITTIPFLIYIVEILPKVSLELIASVILVFVSSYLFMFRELYSISGIVPLFISIYLLNYSYNLIFAPVTVNIAIILYNAYKKRTEYLSKVKGLKKENEKVIKMLIENVQILNKELSITTKINLNNILNKLMNLLEQNSKSNDLEELNQIQKQVEMIKITSNKEINDYLFDLSIKHKIIYNELIKLGFQIYYSIDVEEIDIADPSTLRILFNKLADFRTSLMKINENLNELVNKIEKVSGIKLEEPIISSIEDLSKYYEYIKNEIQNIKLDECVERIINLANIFRENDEEFSRRVSPMILDYANEKTIIRKIYILHDLSETTMNYAIMKIKDIISSTAELTHTYGLISLNEQLSLMSKIPLEEIKNKPSCVTASYLITFADIIKSLLQVIKNIEEIISIINIIKNIEEIISNPLKVGNCVNLSSLGISQKYYWVIRDYFLSKGLKTEISADNLCPKSSS